MNQPTWEDFEARIKRLEQESLEQKEEIRKLKEQRTDEMKAINVNVASADVITRLNTLEEKIDTVQEGTNRVTIQMDGTRADILKMGESQADLRDRLIDHGKHLEAIKEEQERQKEVLGQLLYYAEKHDKMFETVSTKEDVTRLEAAMTTKDDIKDMATKTDISALKTDINSMKSTQEEILKLLRGR